jgi:diaminohydroxyphosphoribosylaminopyrimidine deaminase / 5-amino-6-(5-phosphoribosylamino)uracil reductase
VELHGSHSEPVDEERAWALLRAIAASGAGGKPPTTRLAPGVKQMLELYLPLCQAKTLVFGHVGQSLDGQIATATGASRYVTGPENLLHMHRLRALADAVVVGAQTVERDDPQLTTRLVPGNNPTRVVLDPSLRLRKDRRLFQDAAARTLILCARGRRTNGHALFNAEIVEVPATDGVFSPGEIVRALRELGLERIFIEGGGVTLSRFLAARTLDRLHVTICPLFIGHGKPGIVLPPIDRLELALRPRTRRFALGDDVLFDCQLETAA